jgi:molybdopterin/thiamine biosynthesis adenylyltransferase
MSSDPSSEPTVWQARIFAESIAEDQRALDELRADPRIEFVDRRIDQQACLRELRNLADTALLDEPTRWAYYPWRRAVLGILGPRGFRAVRLDRNRNLITAAEQDRLGQLRIGVAGLSVGHVIAHTIAAQGLCGELRLADFDVMELSNLNRVPATLFDLGVNKAVVAARRIAELDPYLPVTAMRSGITTESVDEFLDGLDVVVEECDSLDMKVVVREAARARRQPVVMATSDRGLIDVERFDLEPTRPILHGLLEIDSAALAGLSNRDKIPHMLGHLDVPRASAKALASMVEVGNTLSTWPQLASDTLLGASAVAEVVRRIGLGEELPSGRTRIDAAAALDGLSTPEPATQPVDDDTGHDETLAAASTDLAAIAAAANRAPSGGNAQPWHIETRRDAMTVRLASRYRSTIDVECRGSAIGVGAAVFNARVAAAHHQRLGPVDWSGGGNDEGESESPLQAVLHLDNGTDPALAALYEPMLRRETNRNHGVPGELDAGIAELLASTAKREGAELRLFTERREIDRVADLVGAADRIRYLTQQLHTEMFDELRWPGDPDPDTGIDIRTLGLDSSDRAVLEVLRRGDVMAQVARWDAGEALGDDGRDRIRASSAIGLVSVHGQTLADYARGGSAAEAVWVVAQERGLAVHPVSPVFIHAHDAAELAVVSAAFSAPLHELHSAFADIAGSGPDDAWILLFRFADAAPTAILSRRRHLTIEGG